MKHLEVFGRENAQFIATLNLYSCWETVGVIPNREIQCQFLVEFLYLFTKNVKTLNTFY